MTLAATSSELEAFRARGYFVRERVFAAAELEVLRSAVERVHTRVVSESRAPHAAGVERIDGKRYQELAGACVKWEWDEARADVRSMEPFVHLDPALDALADDPRLWRPVTRLCGTERLALFTDKLNFKRPGGAPFPWHQDSPYFAFECPHVDRLVSVQVYLDDATAENGCLWMIPGSHRAGVLPGLTDRGVVGRLYTDVERALAEAPRVPLAAPAGSAIFFHGDVVHGSQVNRSSASRRAFVLTYQPAGHSQFRRPGVRDVGATRT
ncbi:MAG TPA: phytanoyl-CoA dioxygenase family protein [Myxococcota bacterium]|nr:phytanoyl-CoA dioxygenase family protein [Myxococcota bacterium]